MMEMLCQINLNLMDLNFHFVSEMKALAADLALRIFASEEPSPQNNSLNFNFIKQPTNISEP